ncbi:MAG: hypothetical protein ACQETE_11090 [Bacteroidota bacterium]
MIRYFLVTLLIFFGSECLAQDSIKVVKSDNHELASILNNISLVDKSSSNALIVKIFEKENLAGSAGYASSEITHMYYIVVSEDGIAPIENLFIIGPFYSPEVKTIQKQKFKQTISISYGPHDDRSKAKYLVSLNEIKQIK